MKKEQELATNALDLALVRRQEGESMKQGSPAASSFIEPMQALPSSGAAGRELARSD